MARGSSKSKAAQTEDTSVEATQQDQGVTDASAPEGDSSNGTAEGTASDEAVPDGTPDSGQQADGDQAKHEGDPDNGSVGGTESGTDAPQSAVDAQREQEAESASSIVQRGDVKSVDEQTRDDADSADSGQPEAPTANQQVLVGDAPPRVGVGDLGASPANDPGAVEAGTGTVPLPSGPLTPPAAEDNPTVDGAADLRDAYETSAGPRPDAVEPDDGIRLTDNRGNALDVDDLFDESDTAKTFVITQHRIYEEFYYPGTTEKCRRLFKAQGSRVPRAEADSIKQRARKG